MKLLDEASKALVRSAFKEYYFRRAEEVEVPEPIAMREFGYINFDGVMIRHLSFSSPGELRAFLVKEVPLSMHCSVALYDEPTLPMDEKGFRSADLVFDIDAEDLKLKCREEHDRWICKVCNTIGKGTRPERCYACPSTRLQALSWPCSSCLGAAKKEVLALIDLLRKDFGLSERRIVAYYSGNMGYHVEVRDEGMRRLDQRARAELVDYIMGRGLGPEILGIHNHTSLEEVESRLPDPQEPGWRGRIARYLLGLPWEGPSGLEVRERLKLLYSKLRYRRFSQLLEKCGEELGIAIDPNVTIDLHRIFRMGGTLHHKTGLAKLRCYDLEGFDPLLHATGVEGDARIRLKVLDAPSFTLRGYRYGPYHNEEAELPLDAAIYLICRGAAKALNNGRG